MKKFFKFGKEKNKVPTPEPSPKVSKRSSLEIYRPRYEIREKDLGKLHKAVWNNDMQKVKQLAKKDATPLDKENRTPLHLACACGFTSIAQELLEWKAKPNVGDNMSRTPLMKAVECKQEDCVKLMLDNKADPNVKDKHGESCLHYAVRDALPTMVQVLLQSDKIFLDIKNQQGQTPFHVACKNRHLKVCEMLLQRGADIDTQDGSGMTALMQASCDGAPDLVKFLLDNRADTTKKNDNGWSAENMAQMEHQDECLDLLIDQGSSRPTIEQGRIIGNAREEDEFSETEGTVSKLSEAGGGQNSWSDSDVLPENMSSNKKIPGLDLNSLHESNEHKAKEWPVLAPRATPRGDPVSSRSNLSAQSALSFGEDKGWSDGDDESLFSSTHNKKEIKPSLIQMQQNMNSKPAITADDTDVDSWGEEESLPLSSARAEKRLDTRSRPLNLTEEQKNVEPSATGGEKSMEFFILTKNEDDKSEDHCGDGNDEENMEQEDTNMLPAENLTKNEDDESDNHHEDENDDENVEQEDTNIIVEKTSEDMKFKVGDLSVTSTQKFVDIPEKNNQRIINELGISDVESISDPEFGEDFRTTTVRGPSKNAAPEPAIKNAVDDDNESDWDSTVVSEHSPQQPNCLPLSARLTESLEIAETLSQDQFDHTSENESDDENEIAYFNQKYEKEETNHPVMNNFHIEVVNGPDDSPAMPSSEDSATKNKDADNAESSLQSPQETHILHEPELMKNGFTPVSKETISDREISGTIGITGGAMMNSSDDCLSYSSTEHEVSIHDDYRSHQLSLPFSKDSTNVMRLQQQLREAQQKLEKEKSAKLSADSKRKSVENERAELIQKLEDVSRAKSQLEQCKIDLDSKIRNIQYQLTEETEKRKNCEVLYNKTKEQLERKEEQYTIEVEDKQKCDLSLRNLQMEIRTLQSTTKQLEEEKEDLQRQLNHERNARMLQEQINEEQVKFQQTLNEDLIKIDSQADVFSHIEAADENQRHAFDTVEKVKAELYATKMELERVRSRSKDDHDIMSSEIDELHMKIDELKGDIKLNEEALAHASLKYNLELAALKTDNTKLVSGLETEKASKGKLQTEVDSLKSRLESTVAELHRAQEARNQLERQGYSQHEDLSRQLERREHEVSHLKDTNESLVQRLNDAENKVNKIESEMHISNATLIERSNQLSTLQKDLDHRRTNQDSLDENLRKAKEDNARLQAKMESVQERMITLQHDNLDLRKELEETRVRMLDEGKEDGDKFTMMLSSMREDHSKQLNTLESQNSGLSENVSKLKEELLNVTNQRNTLEEQLRQLQEQLAEMLRMKSITQAALDVSNKSKEQLETEHNHTRHDLDILKSKLNASQEKQLEAQIKISDLTEKLDKAEATRFAASQQLVSQSGNLEAASRNKSELEDHLHKVEVENAKLEASLKHEAQRVEMLQRELEDSHKEATATRTLANQEAEDSRSLWETEVKSRSKLGLRISQLEREKQEIASQLDEEKKKTRKAMDMKKASESKQDSDQNRMKQLEKEVTLLKTHLKAAKKRLKELDTSDHRMNSLHANFDRERMEMEHTLSTLRTQLDDSKKQLQTEIDMKDQLESKSRQLQAELAALHSMEKSYGKLDKAKRKLEEDLSLYRTHISTNYVERDEMDRLRAELEAKSRIELNQKLEEVNHYLEEQAQARGKLDKMRDTNESEMKKDFERTRNELLEEVSNLRKNNKDLLSQQSMKTDEAKRFKSMYESELKSHEEMTQRLDKASKVASHAQTLIDRQRLSGSLYQQPFESAWASGYNKPSQNYGINDVLEHNMRQQLDRSIAKHMEKGPHTGVTTPLHSLDDSQLL